MASKIPSTDLNADKVDSHKEALDQVRTGLTKDVPDPAAAEDTLNAHAWEIYGQSDYQPKGV